MNSVLTLDFGHARINPEKTPELAGGVFKLNKMKQGTNMPMEWLNIKGYKFNMPWYNFNLTELKCKRTGWYSCRIGMDPSKIGYRNTVDYQKPIIFELIDEFSSQIKYLALVYEWGTNNKLH